MSYQGIDEASYLFAVTKDRFEVYRLAKRATIEPRVEKFHKLLAQPPSDSRSLAYLGEAHTLYDDTDSYMANLIKPCDKVAACVRRYIFTMDNIDHKRL